MTTPGESPAPKYCASPPPRWKSNPHPPPPPRPPAPPGGGGGLDAANAHAGRRLRLEILCQLLPGLEVEPQPAPSNPSVVNQLRRYLLDDVDRYGETDTGRAKGATRVYPHHQPIEVDPRSSPVSRIDGGVGLDPGIERTGSFAGRQLEIVGKVTVLTAHHAERERALQSERTPQRHHVLTDL